MAVPQRFILSVPTDIKREMSDTSGATECFVNGRFSELLQSYIVNYSLSVGSSNYLLTDEPYLQSEKK